MMKQRISLQEERSRVHLNSNGEIVEGKMPPRPRRNTLGAQFQHPLPSSHSQHLSPSIPVAKVGMGFSGYGSPCASPTFNRQSQLSSSYVSSSSGLSPCSSPRGTRQNFLGSLPDITGQSTSLEFHSLSRKRSRGFGSSHTLHSFPCGDSHGRSTSPYVAFSPPITEEPPSSPLSPNFSNTTMATTINYLPYTSIPSSNYDFSIYSTLGGELDDLVFNPRASRITMNFLMPNGVLIPLEVSTISSLAEIKAELWEKASDLPLYGLLQEMTNYHFSTSCRCALSPATDIAAGSGNSSSMELLDEDKTLREVYPLLSFLRVILRKGNEAEKKLNKNVGDLIGKNLSDFDALKNPEVNEFRWNLKALCDEVVKERSNWSWEKRVKYKYPSAIDPSNKLPDYIREKLKEHNDNHILVAVRFSFAVRSVKSTFTFRVEPSVLPNRLMEQALNKFNTLESSRQVVTPFNKDNYIFKTVGREEYFVEEVALFRYISVQEHLATRYQHALTLMAVERSSLNVREDESQYLECVPSDSTTGVRNSFSTMTLGKKKHNSVSSWSVNDNFRLEINTITKLNLNKQNNTKIFVVGGLYHGTVALCTKEQTEAKEVDGDAVSINTSLAFGIAVCDLPRSARLCLGVYEKVIPLPRQQAQQRSGKKSTAGLNEEPRSIAWVNISVFDYRRGLRKGAITLYCWGATQEVELPKPLGTVVNNPDHDSAIAITVNFPRYHQTCDLMYPSQNTLKELAQSQPRQNVIPTNKDEGILQKMASQDPLLSVYEIDASRIWSLRWHCAKTIPHILPRLLQYVQWNDRIQVSQVTELLEEWPKLEPESALELLDYNYAEHAVRDYAVDCIAQFSDEDLLLYLLQLTQALKHENHLNCTLAEFLLQRALNNTKIGHFLFWLLRSEMHVPSVSIRFGLILEFYCKGAQEHMKLLSKQLEALNKFRDLRNTAIKNKSRKTREAFQEIIRKELQPPNFRNLLEPTQELGTIKADSCRSMDSKMAPLWLVFENDEELVSLLYKHGDDLRQDMLTLQTIRIMDKLWKRHGMDFRMNPYRCMSTANLEGLIEGVRNATTIANIQRDKGMLAATCPFRKGSLFEWLADKNSSEASLDKAVSEFTLSCAGYCVATYVLGIADRHSDNIMIMENGQLFHIDFGHILGHFKEKFGFKREHQPFVLTHDFIYVITKGTKEDSQEFKKFKEHCEKAYMCLRKYGNFIISLFAMMISTGLQELQNENDLDYINDRLQLGLSDTEALQHFRKEFGDAMKNSWKTSLNWAFHAMSKDNR